MVDIYPDLILGFRSAATAVFDSYFDLRSKWKVKILMRGRLNQIYKVTSDEISKSFINIYLRDHYSAILPRVMLSLILYKFLWPS